MPNTEILIEVVVGLIGVVAAYGVFQTQRWGVVSTLVLMVVNVLISLPGIPFGPTTFDKVGSAVGAVAGAAVIYLLLRRETKAQPVLEPPAGVSA